MLATVFSDDPENRTRVTDRNGASVEPAADDTGNPPLVPVPISDTGDTSDMRMLCDLDDDWHAVHCHIPTSGRFQVDVYSIDNNVVFIRIGSTVIAVHAGHGSKEALEAYRRATGGE